MLSRLQKITVLLALLLGIMACSRAMAKDVEARESQRLVSRDEGEAIVEAALQHWPQIRDKPDCSHFVHDVYAEAGLDYEYANTNDIFDGLERFERVRKPQPGDLVVWQGHVGIVIDPEDNSFYSSLNSGFSVSSFISSYWLSRGPRRFFRYKINKVQSARLLDRTPGHRPYLTPAPAPATYEARFLTREGKLEDGSPDADLVEPKRNVGAPRISQNLVADAVVWSPRKPSKDEMRSAFIQLSDSRAQELQQSGLLNGPIEIVDSFEAGTIETQGASGWVEIKIKRIALFADGRMSAISGTEKIRFSLLRQADGWILLDSANRIYLLREAAVRMITGRLAALAQSPDNAQARKPLTKALAMLMADDRS